MDPRLASDGVTLADLKEQLDLQLKIGVAVAEARKATTRLKEAREKSKDDVAKAKRIAALEARLVTGGGSYPETMLIDQLGNVARMIGQADQKIGRDAFLRYDDLRKELEALLGEVDAALSSK